MILKDESLNLALEINCKVSLLQFIVNGIVFKLREELIQKRVLKSIPSCQDCRAQF
jgi:hypothetical protein